MATNPDGPVTGRPPTHASRGTVSSPRVRASVAGRDGSAVDGWRPGHDEYGRLPWPTLFGTATTYPREGDD